MSAELEKWINLNKRGAYDQDGKYIGFVFPEHALHALFDGKVLVPVGLNAEMTAVLENDGGAYQSAQELWNDVLAASQEQKQ